MMLYEQVEEREKNLPGGVTTVTGTCRFCGQVATRKALEEWSQEEIDELITETCECVDARTYVYEKEQKERVNTRIDLLFGKDNKSVTIPDAAVDLLHKAAYLVCDGFIQSIMVDMGNGVKAKINLTSKGNIKVVCTKTDTSTYEA